MSIQVHLIPQNLYLSGNVFACFNNMTRFLCKLRGPAYLCTETMHKRVMHISMPA